jgi:ABC-2 type transport system ATP-binding protein
MSLISVQNLSRNYGDHCAVNDISFSVAAGEILGFLGPNGAGKTTTMKMLSGNLAPSEGEIHIDGVDLLDKPKLAKTSIGYLPEQPPLYNEMSVDEYLSYCAKLHHLGKVKARVAIAMAKTRCGLMEVGKRLIGNLSKGFQQRVGIAQAILHSPKVIILDEPTVGLDPNQIREIRDLITELGEEHGIILCTHILPEVQAVCNHVLIINQGKIVYDADLIKFLSERETNSYEVSLFRPPPMQEILDMPGVNNVEQVNHHTFLIHTFNATSEVIAIAAVANNWGLHTLIPHKRTLEHIFVDLTLGDTTVEEASDT